MVQRNGGHDLHARGPRWIHGFTHPFSRALRWVTPKHQARSSPYVKKSLYKTKQWITVFLAVSRTGALLRELSRPLKQRESVTIRAGSVWEGPRRASSLFPGTDGYLTDALSNTARMAFQKLSGTFFWLFTNALVLSSPINHEHIHQSNPETLPGWTSALSCLVCSKSNLDITVSHNFHHLAISSYFSEDIHTRFSVLFIPPVLSLLGSTAHFLCFFPFPLILLSSCWNIPCFLGIWKRAFPERGRTKFAWMLSVVCSPSPAVFVPNQQDLFWGVPNQLPDSPLMNAGIWAFISTVSLDFTSWCYEIIKRACIFLLFFSLVFLTFSPSLFQYTALCISN